MDKDGILLERVDQSSESGRLQAQHTTELVGVHAGGESVFRVEIAYGLLGTRTKRSRCVGSKVCLTKRRDGVALHQRAEPARDLLGPASGAGDEVRGRESLLPSTPDPALKIAQ